MTGTMLEDVKLLGTCLRLDAGQRVKLLKATNQPPPQDTWYFASPIDGSWTGGDSILIEPECVSLDSGTF